MMEKKLLGLDDPAGWAKEYKAKLYLEKGIMELKAFAGIYVGDRGNVIKVKPFYGLVHPDSEYFILSHSQIKRVEKLNLRK